MTTTQEKEAELQKNEDQTEAQLRELNIELNSKHRRFKALLEEKKKIQDMIDKHDEDKLKITRELEKQCESKKDKITKYEQRLSDLEANSGKMHRELEKNFQGQIEEMNRKHDNVMTAKDGEMETLDSNLDTLNHFKDTKQIRKDNLLKEERRYQTLKKQLDELKTNGKVEMESQKQKIEDEFTQQLEKEKIEAQIDAEKNISEIERNIQAQNNRLEQEALVQELELEYLTEKTQSFSNKNQELDVQLGGKVQSNQQIAVKQYEQNKKIKMLKTKIDLLESSLSQIVQDFEKERELIKFQNEQIIKEQNDELKSLTESSRLKMKESINLKALAQMILDQRSDIEQFFLEALEQVKEEKRRKLEAERNAENQLTQNQNMQKQYTDGLMYMKQQDQLSGQQQKITVELSDLDWEDRERILRLLFSKMNTGASASDWRDKEEESQRGGSSHLATAQLNQSFREQEDEEDYGDEQDAQIFAQTTVPENGMQRQQDYYDEEDQSNQN